MGDARTSQDVAALVARRLAERQGEFAVIGLARSGIAAVRLLRAAGLSVYASDTSKAEAVRSAGAMLERDGASVELGIHNVQRIAHCSVLVVSPGIPPTAPPIRAALSAGVPVVSEVEVGLRLLPALRYIAVTGTNGKTTTTALIGHLLRALGHEAADVGNIGTPVSELALMKTPPTWAALELSSFQLHDTPGIMPDVGVITTLSPDHLDRYGSVADYYADKKRLFANAEVSSRWVTTADSADVDALVAGIPGQWHRFSVHRTDVDGYYHRGSGMLHVFGEPLVARDTFALAGDHNVANALAALLAVMAADPLHRIPSALADLDEFTGDLSQNPHIPLANSRNHVANRETRPTQFDVGQRGGEESSNHRPVSNCHPLYRFAVVRLRTGQFTVKTLNIIVG